MGTAGSVEQDPAKIIVTPARKIDDTNHINTSSSSSRRNSNAVGAGGGTGNNNNNTINMSLESSLNRSTQRTVPVEYIGVWEYKLASSSGDGTLGEDTDESEGWTVFSSSDQDRLEENFSNKGCKQNQNPDDQPDKNPMVMVGRTAWNVNISTSIGNNNTNNTNNNKTFLFKMSRGSGHSGIVRRKMTEKPDVNAPSPFDDDSNNNAAKNLFSEEDISRDMNEYNRVSSSGSNKPNYKNTFEVYLNATVKAHKSLVYCIDFSRDGQKVLSGSRDGTFRYWELGSSQVVCDYYQIKDGVILSCAISPNNRFAVSGSSNSKAYLWSTERSQDRACGETNQFQKPIEVFAGHTHKVYGAKFSADSKTLVTGAMDHSLRTWDVARAVPIRKLVPHTAAVFTIAASRTTPYLFLSGADDHLLVSHDLRTPNEKGVNTFKGHRATIWASDIRHDDGLFLSAGMDGACLLWDPRNGSKPLQHVGDHGVFPVHCAEFMPEGNYVLTSARDSTFRLWDIQQTPDSKNNNKSSSSNDEHQHHQTQSLPVSSSFNPQVMDPCCKDVCKVTAHTGNVFKIAYEPIRNKVMSCGSDGLIKIWDLKQQF